MIPELRACFRASCASFDVICELEVLLLLLEFEWVFALILALLESACKVIFLSIASSLSPFLTLSPT